VAQGSTECPLGASHRDVQAYRVLTLLLDLRIRSRSPRNHVWKSPVVEQYEEGAAEEARHLNIDSLKEARCAALVQSTRYLEEICNIKERSFNIGDMVLKHIQDIKGMHKLYSPWEGPYIVSKVIGPGSYRIQTLTGEEVNNSWNIERLCQFYPWSTYSCKLATDHNYIVTN